MQRARCVTRGSAAPKKSATTPLKSEEPVDVQQESAIGRPDPEIALRVDLVSTGWENMSDPTQRTRGGYQLGWGLVLDRFAGRFRPVLLFFYGMSLGITLIGQRGKFVRTSLGKMED